MTTSKEIKKKAKKSSGSRENASMQFLIWHGEKIAVGIVAVVALGLAVQGLGGYSTVSWRPEVLTDMSQKARQSIESREPDETDKEQITTFDYAVYAEQIRDKIPTEPYGNRGVLLYPTK